MANISIYGSHNASYVVEDKGEILMVIELERLFNYKNSALSQYMCPPSNHIMFLAEYIPQYIKKKFNIDKFDTCYYLNTDTILGKLIELNTFVKADKYVECLHHQSHAAGCFYQSPFKEALIFSFDGGGNDGKFNIYKCVKGESPNLIEKIYNPSVENRVHYDLGFPYMIFAEFLGDIKRDPLNIGNLVYSGKLMGLASYGKVREEWLPHFIEFYKSNPNGDRINGWEPGSCYDYDPKIIKLGEQIDIKFDEYNRLTGQDAYDIAATSQRAFEECFLEIAKPYFEKYPELPICIAGGCGLNIILNTRLVTEFKREVFVGPNPNDCGIGLGMMLNALKPQESFDATYSGIDILDIESLTDYLHNSAYNGNPSFLDIEKLTDDLVDGKIVGVVRGRSEHGPRALGNRSIICNPSIPEMKDILNEKVKHREWYRPFAPVVRLEDVSKYFHWEGESRWMSFCPLVRDEWKEKLAAITHVDGSARVQTVTREQNTWLYDLITEFEKKTGIGVLLNTSFNVDGKPILSTLKDAFTIYKETDLDCLVIEDYYISKH